MRIISRNGALAAMAMLGILLVFFFPSIGGPFSIRNGPVTVFRTLVAARRLFYGISAALLVTSARRCILYLECMKQAAVHVNCDLELFTLRC